MFTGNDSEVVKCGYEHTLLLSSLSISVDVKDLGAEDDNNSFMSSVLVYF